MECPACGGHALYKGAMYDLITKKRVHKTYRCSCGTELLIPFLPEEPYWPSWPPPHLWIPTIIEEHYFKRKFRANLLARRKINQGLIAEVSKINDIIVQMMYRAKWRVVVRDPNRIVKEQMLLIEAGYLEWFDDIVQEMVDAAKRADGMGSCNSANILHNIRR